MLHNLRSRDHRETCTGIELSPEEIKDASEEIVRLAQREAFPHEHAAVMGVSSSQSFLPTTLDA